MSPVPPRVTCDVDGPLATLRLRTALDAALVRDLGSACERLAAADAVRCVVLLAAPQVWRGWAAGALDTAEEDGLLGDPFAPLAALPQPSVAALAGAVLDAGLELALAADLRVAGPDLRLGMPGLGAGAFPVAGGLQRLSRAVGRARALDLILRGEPLDAATAHAWGLVGAVAPDPAAAAHALAARIAERGPIAVRLAKEAVARGLDMPLHQALRYETDLTILLQTTADRAEGVRAFIAKRPPHFTGT